MKRYFSHALALATLFSLPFVFSSEAYGQDRRRLQRDADDFAFITTDVLQLSEREAPRRPDRLEQRALDNLAQLELSADRFARSLNERTWETLKQDYRTASRTNRDLTAYRWNARAFDELDQSYETLHRSAERYFYGNNGGGGGGGGGQLQSIVVGCHSLFRLYAECNVAGVRQIESVRPARTYSNTECINGQTYGFFGNTLWVNRGCRADFTVFYRR